MKLPNPPASYSPPIERQRNLTIEIADGQNLKTDRDNDIGRGRLIFRDTDTSGRLNLFLERGVLKATDL